MGRQFRGGRGRGRGGSGGRGRGGRGRNEGKAARDAAKDISDYYIPAFSKETNAWKKANRLMRSALEKAEQQPGQSRLRVDSDGMLSFLHLLPQPSDLLPQVINLLSDSVISNCFLFHQPIHIYTPLACI